MKSLGRMVVLITVLSLMLLTTMPTGSIDTGQDLLVEHDTDSVYLPRDGTAEVEFVVTNQGSQDVNVAFFVIPPRSPDAPDMFFATTFAHVRATDYHLNTLIFASNPGFLESTSDSSCVVQIYWGKNLTVDGDDVPDPATVDGMWERQFAITDEGPDIGFWPLVLVLALIVVIVVGFIMYPAWAMRHESMDDGHSRR
jgi:hypothetical protein